jgi:hypothetical protein
MIALTFVAVVDDFPKHIKLKEHSLEFPESEHLQGSVITGVYGTSSKQVALVMASAWNKHHETKRGSTSRALLIDSRYRIDNFMDNTRPLATREQLDMTGWLHMDRLTAGLREEIKEEWLEWIAEDFEERHRARMADLGLVEIALAHPRYIQRMMAKRAPRLTAIIHPIHPSLAPKETVWAATVRYEKERFHETAVRFGAQVVDL